MRISKFKLQIQLIKINLKNIKIIYMKSFNEKELWKKNVIKWLSQTE